MSYNIHPIFVHFPIAFLVVYSIVKVIPLYRWFPNVAWKQIERVLLVVGVLGAFAAMVTGGMAQELTHTSGKLVDMHSTFAFISVVIYSLLLIGEAVSFFPTKRLAITLHKILTHRILARILAILGLVAITLTGLLGGVMVYGTSADPFAAIVLKILGIEY